MQKYLALSFFFLISDTYAASISHNQALQISQNFTSIGQELLAEIEDVKTHRLQVNILWEDERFTLGGAYAKRQQDGATTFNQIFVEGGLIRHKRISPHSLVLVLCHELGHLIGARSLARYGLISEKEWFSFFNELTIDYFATSICLPRLMSVPYFSLLFEEEFDHNPKKAIFEVSWFVYDISKFLKLPGRENELIPSWDIESESFKQDFSQCSLESYFAGLLRAPMPKCSYN